jgi:hypothetical protein
MNNLNHNMILMKINWTQTFRKKANISIVFNTMNGSIKIVESLFSISIINTLTNVTT